MSEKKRFEVADKEGNALTEAKAMVFVDNETGVNYLFVQSGYAGGLTPLLDADGKTVITR